MAYGELNASFPARTGEPCRVCGSAIGPAVHHVHAKRHACSKRCSDELVSLLTSGATIPPVESQRGFHDPVRSWVAIDFESANSSRASVCQVGMVSVSDGQIDDTFDSFIRPMNGFDEFYGINVRTHGLTYDDVVDAPSWPEVWEHMLKFIDGRPIVAHSAASIEVSMIRQSCALWSIPVAELRYACSRQIGKGVWNVEALKKCAKKAHVPLDNHHDALNDATACAQIVLAAMRVARVDDISALLAHLGVSWNRIAPFRDPVRPPAPESPRAGGYRTN